MAPHLAQMCIKGRNMISNKTLFSAAMAGLAFIGPVYAQDRNFDLAGFTGIDIANGITAKVTQASTFSVTANAQNPDALDKLRIEVLDGVLVARLDTSFADFVLSGGIIGLLKHGSNAITVDIELPALDSAEVSSGAKIALHEITASTLVLDASSGARLELPDASVEQLTARTTSGSTMTLSGNADAINLDASTGSDIHADGLEANDGTLEASSGAVVHARLSSKVRASASSGGVITVEGNPEHRDTTSTGGGAVHIEQ